MTIEEAIERIADHMEVHRIGRPPHIKLAEALNMSISALRAQVEAERNDLLTPCDLCMYNPPSSFDGKPCCVCPATAKHEPEEDDNMLFASLDEVINNA